MPGLDGLEIETLLAPVAHTRRLALAVSGGPDSLALMLLAAEWARTAGRPGLVVYTVDHGLREAAAGEVTMVVREATSLGLNVRPLRWVGEKPETGVQAAARKARYGMMAAQTDDLRLKQVFAETAAGWLRLAADMADLDERMAKLRSAREKDAA